jgi:hypothetical protein
MASMINGLLDAFASAIARGISTACSTRIPSPPQSFAYSAKFGFDNLRWVLKIHFFDFSTKQSPSVL